MINIDPKLVKEYQVVTKQTQRSIPNPVSEHDIKLLEQWQKSVGRV